MRGLRRLPTHPASHLANPTESGSAATVTPAPVAVRFRDAPQNMLFCRR